MLYMLRRQKTMAIVLQNSKIIEEMWLTRDKNNSLYLAIGEKPIKREFMWTTSINKCAYALELDSSLFPEVQWSDDEPTKVKLIIDK